MKVKRVSQVKPQTQIVTQPFLRSEIFAWLFDIKVLIS